MTATALKKKLHKAIDMVNDPQLLDALHTIISKQVTNEIREDSHDHFELTKDQKKKLDKLHDDYQSGRGKYYTWVEAKKLIKKVRIPNGR